MSDGVTFTVWGVPVPQGSKSAIVRGGRAVVVEGNRAKLRPWRSNVAAAAAAAMDGAGLLTGPVKVSACLMFPRPKTHYRGGAFAHQLKPSAPHYVTTRPDGEKVARAIGDALTGVVFRDDAQVAQWLVTKVYGDPPRAIIDVTPLDGVSA